MTYSKRTLLPSNNMNTPNVIPFPRQTIRLVLGFSPGSASDQIARLIAPALSRELGKTIDIELRPGQNGAKAAADVAVAEADGRTLFVATLGTHALAPHLDAELPYDPLHHFAPVSLVVTAPMVLACNPGLPVSDAAALIELARSKPGALSYGTSAIGGAPHLAAELFQTMAGVEMRHVRYDHTERLYEDLEAGRITLSFNNMMSMLPRCRSGKLRALGVTSVARSPAAPELPTLAESAVPGYEMSNWVGIVAPKATPPSAVEALGKAIAAAVADDAVRAAFVESGVTGRGSTPEEFGVFMQQEIARWGPVVARFRDVEA